MMMEWVYFHGKSEGALMSCATWAACARAGLLRESPTDDNDSDTRKELIISACTRMFRTTYLVLF